MLKNGKYFFPPPKNDADFKELFRQVTAAGAGRPVDDDGFSQGPWTPELLTDAISKIDANRDGIELRTVQLWFQDNLKGVSTDNIRWLARIFGCDDQTATRDWQIVLIAAQKRLVSKRRTSKEAANPNSIGNELLRSKACRGTKPETAELVNDNEIPAQGSSFSLAKRSEAIFTRRSPLDLPVLVFAGAVALGFLAYMFRIHSFIYSPDDGPVRQVGFVWAPNWTILFLALLPAYLAFASELLMYWKSEGRLDLTAGRDKDVEDKQDWRIKVEASKYSYWAGFALCLPFAALFQWINSRFIPLTTGDPGNFAMDWGRIAIVRPDIVSVPQALTFTGLAYSYMGVCFYLFFAGSILLHTLTHDFWELGGSSNLDLSQQTRRKITLLGHKIMNCIFRCTLLGLLIAITMKLQSAFLISGKETILQWLSEDLLSIGDKTREASVWLNRITPTHYSSLLVAMVSCVTFMYGIIRISSTFETVGLTVTEQEMQEGPGTASMADIVGIPRWKMTCTVMLLAANYLLIGVFEGFSILLAVGVILAIYCLFDPCFGKERVEYQNGGRSVF